MTTWLGCHHHGMGLEALEIVAITTCVVSWMLLLRRQFAATTAWLFLACALTIPLAGVRETSPAPLFTISLVVTGLVPAVAAVAGLSWPGRPMTVIDRAAAIGAVLIAGLLTGLAPALVLDPRAAGCNRCPGNLLEIHPAPALATSLDRAAAVLSVGWGTTVAVLAVRRWILAPRLARRHSWPLLLGGASIALLAAAQAARDLTLPAGVFDPFTDMAMRGELALLVLMAAGVWYRLSLPRRVARRVARAVLSATPTPTTLVDSLARAVGDPDLTVTFNRIGGDRIDLQGRPAPAPDDRSALRLTRDGTTYAEIWYGLRLGSAGDLVHAVATSSGPALEYFAAQARLRAETLDATAARQRIVVKADAERKRLERDLHDGAQQGLITLSMQLTAAAGSAPGQSTARRLHTAQREISEALEDLRSVARGLFPVSLAEAGINAALRELGDHSPVPLLVEGSLAGPCSPETDTAVYHLVLDVVNGVTAGAGALVQVTLSAGGTEPARILITAPPVDPGTARRLVVRSEDRLIALGGNLTITETKTRLTLEGAIPCGS